MNDQLVVEVATHTTYNKHKRQTPKPSTGFEPTFPAFERPQTYNLVRMATGTSLIMII